MKKKIYFFAILCTSLSVTSLQANAQGCVAVRPMGCTQPGNLEAGQIMEKGQFQFSGAYRYFKSHRHFVGDSYQEQRATAGTEVVNVAHSVDLGVGYAFTRRFSAAVNLPVISYDRSSLYEHYGNTVTANPDQLRFHTQAMGIGDLRLTAYYWLWDPAKPHLKGNILMGLGVKLPTGNSNVKDDFHKRRKDGSDSTVSLPVDQSIQLGDGGVGFTIETQSYLQITSNLSGYFSGFYMFNPQVHNNTARSSTPSITQYYSIADQYAARLGASYFFSKAGLAVSLGGRIEGVPAIDIIGSSWGFRRPGYIVSADPNIAFFYRKFDITVGVPYAIYRNRTKSFADRQDPTGKAHGDAAFADYQVNITLRYRAGGKHTHHEMMKLDLQPTGPSK